MPNWRRRSWEATLAQADSSRRRRRRRRQQKSGLSGKQSEKKMREVMADDMAAGQGRFAAERKEEKQAAYMGLNATDIAAIKSLGSALRGAGDEAKGLAAAADVSAAAAVSPNDKSATERAVEAAKRPRRNNNRRGGGGGTK